MEDDEKYDYEVLEYIKDHPLPNNKEDMSPEQYVIRSVIDDYIHDLRYYINKLYFELSLYIFCQDEYDAFGICDHVNNILYFHNYIENLMYCYFYENSPIFKYCNIDKIFDEEFNFHNHDYCNDTNYTLDKYKDLRFDFKDNIYQMLKEDARTEEAKKYFYERKLD